LLLPKNVAVACIYLLFKVLSVAAVAVAVAVAVTKSEPVLAKTTTWQPKTPKD